MVFFISYFIFLASETPEGIFLLFMPRLDLEKKKKTLKNPSAGKIVSIIIKIRFVILTTRSQGALGDRHRRAAAPGRGPGERERPRPLTRTIH